MWPMFGTRGCTTATGASSNHSTRARPPHGDVRRLPGTPGGVPSASQERMAAREFSFTVTGPSRINGIAVSDTPSTLPAETARMNAVGYSASRLVGVTEVDDSGADPGHRPRQRRRRVRNWRCRCASHGSTGLRQVSSSRPPRRPSASCSGSRTRAGTCGPRSSIFRSLHNATSEHMQT